MNTNFDKIEIIPFDTKAYNEKFLDDFILKQHVTKCWRKVNDTYMLVPVCYTEDWNLLERRKIAQKVIGAVNGGATAFIAVNNDSVVGFALITNSLFGSQNQYVDLAEFYVSQPYRRQGIGKKLFETISFEAKKCGAKKLYISAHSAEESISAYKKYGCVFAKEPDLAHIEKEPYDLQLEYDLATKIYSVNDKEKYFDFLLLADEQKEMIYRYLDKSTMFVLDDCGVKGEITIMSVGNGILEIKNLAVLPKFQRCGYGKKLIEFVEEKYKGEYAVLQVGTGDSPLTLPFYKKCGFTISHTIKDFFTKNYDHPIIEEGVVLKDMLYLVKNI